MNKGSYHRVVVVLLAVCFAQATGYAGPREELGADSQGVRDKAAKVLRETFMAAPRKKWAPVLAMVKKGDSHEKVLETLAAYHAVERNEGGDLGMVYVSYQLDDAWELACQYRGTGNPPWTPGTLTGASLMRHVSPVTVKAPPVFTGVWTTYYTNGEKFEQAGYKDGLLFGDDVRYNDDGTKASMSRYPIQGYRTEEIDYWPSGRVQLSGKRDEKTHAWHWVHYKADGSVSYRETGE